MNPSVIAETPPALYFCDHPDKLLRLDPRAITKEIRQEIRELHQLNYL